ncbi:NitT/TauT family transport system substrate-binding protein [Humitalea rosea]|uniref:NitT/TauT family transport system substrate-binding protein n=1 Tax=Humitalea rosea TaxID=990373 RepID=A0A2W7HYN9_9PROT|nr:ABC transporter substrate-binding protein [Humitalea rosea]PZW39801.1 NitT/TauT family transport system substrate-binding protein [Humitalea rosea]
MPILTRRTMAGAAFLSLAAPRLARAEVSEVRFAEGFGLSYLPITVMAHEQMVDRRARAMGLGPVNTRLLKLTGGPAMIDAMLAGQVDFISGGVPPMINLWDKTVASLHVKAIASMGNSPLHLNTIVPDVHDLAGLVDKGRIALPAVRISVQALTLQMACEKAFGRDDYQKLDRQTVSMPHPEAMQALLGGRTEITSHFASMPFLWYEAKDTRVARVLSSRDVLGGNHTGAVLYNSGRWRDANPKVFDAVALAIDDANTLINEQPRRAAEIYAAANPGRIDLAEIEAMIADRETTQFTSTPERVMPYVEFMHRRGQIKTMPASWKDLFWDNMHDRAGS